MALETGVIIQLLLGDFLKDYLGAETRLFLVFDVGDLLKKRNIFIMIHMILYTGPWPKTETFENQYGVVICCG